MSLSRFLAGAALALIAAASLAAAPAAHAKDAPGCKDLYDLKRFEGSSLEACDKKDFAEYRLATGKFTGYDFNTKRLSAESQLDLEGRLNQLAYRVPKGPSSAEVFRNYKLDLEAKGFKLLFEAKSGDIGRMHGPHFGDGLGGQIFGYAETSARYAAAVKEVDGAKIYMALYVVDYENGYAPKLGPAKGEVWVRLDTVQVGELKDRMAVVSAAEMAASIDKTGKVALYGIHFDFNKADIKPESRPALDEIARLLQSDPARRLYVVGHTDSVGGFDSNITLSNNRAKSVVADLVRTYGIQAARLRPSGVGLQAPIATNTTEEGRALNRRVELLPQ